MELLILTAQHADGSILKAVFDPARGMNLDSFSKGSIEYVHHKQGSLIGPHLDNRPKHLHKPHENDPFPNGIARAAAWKAEIKNSKILAVLDSKEPWENSTVGAQEGQNFKMYFQASLTPHSLSCEISIVSDTDSLVGTDIHLNLPPGNANITTQVASHCIQNDKIIPAKDIFHLGTENTLSIPLDNNAIHYAFTPFNPLTAHIDLNTSEYSLRFKYHCPSQENCWRLIKAKDDPFIRIQPLSSQDPRFPNLTVSSLFIDLEPL
ncbi:MAG: hypothetical protein WC222_06340 [Parachlamydiales bacterium]|jgi:hypothetical protein